MYRDPEELVKEQAALLEAVPAAKEMYQDEPIPVVKEAIPTAAPVVPAVGAAIQADDWNEEETQTAGSWGGDDGGF